MCTVSCKLALYALNYPWNSYPTHASSLWWVHGNSHVYYLWHNFMELCEWRWYLNYMWYRVPCRSISAFNLLLHIHRDEVVTDAKQQRQYGLTLGSFHSNFWELWIQALLWAMQPVSFVRVYSVFMLGLHFMLIQHRHTGDVVLWLFMHNITDNHHQVANPH